MKKWIALVLAMLLLPGCAPGEVMEPTEPVADPAQLRQLDCAPLAQMETAVLRRTEEGLLLCGGDDRMELVLLDEQTMAVKEKTLLEQSPNGFVWLLGDRIAVSDPEGDAVTVLSRELEVLETVEAPEEADVWFLCADGDTLLGLDPDVGFLRRSRSGGKTEVVVPVYTMSLLGWSSEGLVAACVDRPEQLTRYFLLDPNAGTLTELEGRNLLAAEAGLLGLPQGGYFCPGREMAIYTGTGVFLTRCALPEDRRTGSELIWSELHQGWLFLSFGGDEPRLMLWKPAAGMTGENVDLTPETAPAGELLSPELYDRAAELSDRFGLDIRIGERAIRDYKSYTADMLLDEGSVRNALDILEGALEQYPEGFIPQLAYSDVRTIRIELVADLRRKEGTDVSSDNAAFAQKRSGCYLLVLNGAEIRDQVIFHEFSHVIDRNLAWDAKLRTDAMYSEEGWLALQPEGFEYAGSYQNIPDSVKAFYDSGYFARKYACVSATEDRAVTLEQAMLLERTVFGENPGLIPKLEYYCACIRDCFDASLWTEPPLWEQLLAQLGGVLTAFW